MNEKKTKETFDRNQLLKVLKTTGAALAKRGADAPVFECFCFTGEKCFAYNGVIAIEVACASQFRGALPGELLSKFVASCSEDSISLEDKETSVTVRSGKSQLTLPVISPDKFVSIDQTHTKFADFELGKDFIRGVEYSLLSVSSSGVTFDFIESGSCEMYSTNGYTVSYYSAACVPFEGQFSAPEIFCRALANLGKTLEKDATFFLVLPDDFSCVKAEFGDDIVLTSRVIEGAGAGQFRGIIDRYDVDESQFWKWPPALHSSIERSMLLAPTAEGELYCTLKIEDGNLDISTRTAISSVEDVVDIRDVDAKPVTVFIPVEKVKTALKFCDRICVNSECAIFSASDINYTQYIATKSGVQSTVV